VNTHHHRNGTTIAPASGQHSKLGAGPDPDHNGAIGAQALAVISDYDQVRTWSDPSARQCELVRIGATAVDLLRRLSA
jgi:hypothetical protein